MKSTNNKAKTIATLGVVVGLGLAAFPAFSYATTSISGDTQVETEVTPALAMRIHSNADATGEYGFIGYNPAEAQGSSDPAATTAGAASQATGLSLSSNQADSTTLYSNIEVRSNTGKFKLEVADADTDTAMRNASASTTTNEYIPAGITTTTSGGETVIDPTVAGWALKGGDITDWTAITANNATPLTIKNVGSNTTNPLSYSDSLTVNYAVASGLTKTGVYNDTITYTATALDSNYGSTLTPSERAAAFAACGSNEGDRCTVAGTNYVRSSDGSLQVQSVLSPNNGPQEGDTETIDGVEYIYLRDGRWWTHESQGDAEVYAVNLLCPSGTTAPVEDDFVNLLLGYGATRYTTNDGAVRYNTDIASSSLHDATGWSGFYGAYQTSNYGGGWEGFALKVNDSSFKIATINAIDPVGTDPDPTYGVLCYR